MGTPGRQALTTRLPVAKGEGCHPPSRQENHAFNQLSHHAERTEQRDEELIDAEAQTGNLKALQGRKARQRAAYWMVSFMGDPRKEKDCVVESRPVVAAA